MASLDRWLLGHLLDSKPSQQELSKRAYRKARSFYEHFSSNRSRQDRQDSIAAQTWAAIVAREERDQRLGGNQ